MSVDTEGFAMFLHVALVVAGMMLAAVLHTGLLQLRRADTVAEMRPWVPLIRRLEPILPIVALAILFSGAWLIELSDGEFEWGDAWIGTSLIGLIVAEGVGAFLHRPSHALTEAVAQARDGAVPADLRHQSLDPRLWFGAHFITAEFFGIIFLMAAKPTETWACALALVIAGVLGLGSALPFTHVVHARPAIPKTPGPGTASAGT